MQLIRHTSMEYPAAVREQERLVAQVLAGEAAGFLVLTEHPPVYTIGTSGTERDILRRHIDGEDIAVYASGRGGEVTYHGPGQLVCYVIADLRAQKDLHRHVWRLEEMIIRTLHDFGLQGSRNPRGIGVWLDTLKIAAVGVRCRKWITYHGIALNITPNMNHFRGIVTCGMHDQPVTSMQQAGIHVKREEVEPHIIRHAESLFGNGS